MRVASIAATKVRLSWSIPEDVWYTYVDKEDIDEIIEEHLKNGRWSSGCEFRVARQYEYTVQLHWLSTLLNSHIPQKLFLDGPAGKLETVLAEPN